MGLPSALPLVLLVSVVWAGRDGGAVIKRTLILGKVLLLDPISWHALQVAVI